MRFLRIIVVGTAATLFAIYCIVFGPKLTSHLIVKYLRKRRIAWVSLVAVTLCTAMVLVVISVMGGWLRMFRASFHGLGGDVIIQSRSLAGFPYYEEMIEKLEALPTVEAAVPTIQTFGLIDVRNYIYEIAEGVQVIGYPIDQIGRVNEFAKSLHRQYEVRREMLLEEAKAAGSKEERERLLAEAEKVSKPSFELLPNVSYEDYVPERIASSARKWPGMIVGASFIGVRKNQDGDLERPPGIYNAYANLTVLGMSNNGAPADVSDKQARNYWIVDDSRTQIYQYDKNTVYVPFHILQQDLGMDERKATNREGEEVTLAARTNTIHIKVKPGVDLMQVREQAEEVAMKVFNAHDLSVERYLIVETWEQSQAVWLGAIEKEKALVTFLFGMISIVAIFLIFCIFYMIVVEKTKDIGIIKSVGATSSGVAGIFLGYGLAIGLVGAGLGLLAGYLIVSNINYLHEQMGRLMGVKIWDPEVYAFDTIPNTMNPNEVLVILGVAIVASVFGALVPAIRAARMHPVEALRWE